MIYWSLFQERFIFLGILLKSNSHLPNKNVFIWFNESSLKRWKILFISSWKLFSFTGYFCLDFLVMSKKPLHEKHMVEFKIMTSQPNIQIIIIHILPIISRFKSHQMLKFCQLIEYNKGNVFLQNFKINLIKSFFCTNKTILKRLSVAKKLLQTWECVFKLKTNETKEIKYTSFLTGNLIYT